jgi:predicted nucleic acid-binding protein
MRVVIDTNVVVSGLLWRGRPRQLLDAVRSGRIEVLTSRVLLAELEDVLGRDKFADQLRNAGLTAQAEAIVSGDSHLLDLKEYRAIPILTVMDVLNYLASSP